MKHENETLDYSLLIWNTYSKDTFLIRYDSIINDLPEKITETDFHVTCARRTSLFGTAHTVPMENLLGKRTEHWNLPLI